VLRVTVVLTETFDEITREFGVGDTFDFELEHSLATLSKWESKYERAFLSNVDKSQEELLWYIRTMILTPEVPEAIFSRVSQKNIDEITEYINSAQSATKFPEENAVNNQPMTAELIYYWMTAFQIPFECQHWHLNRLLTLIRVCILKSSPPKKMNKHEQLARQRELNEQRKRELGTKG
jgi:hypothetical protein